MRASGWVSLCRRGSGGAGSVYQPSRRLRALAAASSKGISAARASASTTFPAHSITDAPRSARRRASGGSVARPRRLLRGGGIDGPDEYDRRGVSEWREKWPNGIPSTGQLPKSCYRMASKGIPLPWRWNGGTISLNLVVIWEMSTRPRRPCRPGPLGIGWPRSRHGNSSSVGALVFYEDMITW